MTVKNAHAGLVAGPHANVLPGDQFGPDNRSRGMRDLGKLRVATMQTYRVYRLKDERVVGPPATIECADDFEAIGKAKQLRNGCAVEVWCLDRRVIRLDPRSPPAPEALRREA